MENHSYSDIIGNTSQAPYINSIAHNCGLATDYHNTTHPSLPNYLAATSGIAQGSLPATVYLDCNVSVICDMTVGSIFGQGETWKAYEESMPSNCDKSNSGEYAVRHNPPVYYTSLSGCASRDVPYTQLATDLANAIEDCDNTGTTDSSCRVPTIVISPTTPVGVTSGTFFDHYSLLGTTEQLLRLPRLASAASATTMTAAFHL